jgi:hypothetical protein
MNNSAKKTIYFIIIALIIGFCALIFHNYKEKFAKINQLNTQPNSQLNNQSNAENNNSSLTEQNTQQQDSKPDIIHQENNRYIYALVFFFHYIFIFYFFDFVFCNFYLYVLFF